MTKKILVDHVVLGQLLRAVTGPSHWLRELLATRSLDAMLSSEAEERNPINVLIEQFNDPKNLAEADAYEQCAAVLAEAYVVAGELLGRTGEFHSPRAVKLLDNLSQMRKVHDDVLPWTYPATEGLQWSKPAPANDEIHYDHVIAQTPFGRILITWKSWKDQPKFDIEEMPGDEYSPGLPAASSLEAAKEVALERYYQRLRESVAEAHMHSAAVQEALHETPQQVLAQLELLKSEPHELD